KSSCATRLKVSAATVLSRRGAVIPHVQWEQHQPLKSSPSIQIRCLFISAFARVLGLELGLRWVGHQASEFPPSPWVISHEIIERPSTKGAPPQPRPKGHVGGCPGSGLDAPGAEFASP